MRISRKVKGTTPPVLWQRHRPTESKRQPRARMWAIALRQADTSGSESMRQAPNATCGWCDAPITVSEVNAKLADADEILLYCPNNNCEAHAALEQSADADADIQLSEAIA